MTTNIEVSKSNNENNTGLIRRFSRQVKESGLIQSKKKNRYRQRDLSDTIVKKQKLKKIARGTEIKRLIKLGKIQPRTPNNRGRRK